MRQLRARDDREGGEVNDMSLSNQDDAKLVKPSLGDLNVGPSDCSDPTEPRDGQLLPEVAARKAARAAVTTQALCCRPRDDGT